MYTETAYPVIDLVETGRCIERQRRQAGLTVRDLQAYFGFEYPQAIYKWQHGECLPTVDNLLALARLLRVSMEDLLVYEDQGGSLFWNAFVKTKKTKQVFTCFGSLPRISPMTMRCSQLPVNCLPSWRSRRRCLHNRADAVPTGGAVSSEKQSYKDAVTETAAAKCVSVWGAFPSWQHCEYHS